MKKFNLLLSAAMLISVVAATNCEIIERPGAKTEKAEKDSKKECQCAKCQSKREEAKAIEKERDVVAKEIQRNLLDNTDAVTLEVKRKDQYMGVTLRNEDKVGYEVRVYNLDAKTKVYHMIPSKKIRTLDFDKDNNLVLKWTGLFRTETTFQIDEKCEKCGKVHTGRVKKKRSLYGWAPSL